MNFSQKDILWFLQDQSKDDSMEDEIDSLISQIDPSVSLVPRPLPAFNVAR